MVELFRGREQVEGGILLRFKQVQQIEKSKFYLVFFNLKINKIYLHKYFYLKCSFLNFARNNFIIFYL